MPIGAAKLGVLGAGLVPGGTETFNAPGTFSIPPGVKKVSITGTGGSGNPGTSGTAGNSGNFGGGGSGGGGTGISGGIMGGGAGGAVFLNAPICAAKCIPTGYPANILRGGLGGGRLPAFNVNPGGSGSSGSSGNAGSAGSAGSAGNAGQASSGLGNNFAGGTAGNAGNAGAAGNGGTGGQGGGGGITSTNPSVNSQGGSGGNGGGAGSPGPAQNVCVPGGGTTGFSGGGGGGAGVTNDGQAGFGFSQTPPPVPGCPNFLLLGAAGGTTAGFSVPISNSFPARTCKFPAGITTDSTGGAGGMGVTRNAGKLGGPIFCANPAGGYGMSGSPCGSGGSQARGGTNTPNPLINAVNQNNPGLRSGAGGGSGSNRNSSFSTGACNTAGGGGGGRGNAGNAGGAGGAGGTGGAGTSQTFNCVPVSPGTTTPITVGTPGGQIVISWNPQ